MNSILTNALGKACRLFYKTILLTLVSICIFSCQKGSTTEVPYPTLAIYKTNGDYFHKMNVSVSKDSVVYTFASITEKGATLYNHENISGYYNRVPLENGYILTSGIRDDAFFTDLSYKDYLEFYNRHFVRQDSASAHVEFINHVIDEDPFQEYYEVNGKVVFKGGIHPEDYPGLGIAEIHFRMFLQAAEEINEIIKNDKLEENFRRMK